MKSADIAFILCYHRLRHPAHRALCEAFATKLFEDHALRAKQRTGDIRPFDTQGFLRQCGVVPGEEPRR